MIDQAAITLTDWLASAHKVPAQARREFDVGIALLPTGAKFDALRLPAPMVHAAARSDDPDAVAVFLAEVLDDGAVIHDAYGVGVWYYALVPPGTHAAWRMPGVECLQPGTRLGVPRIDLTARPGPYWALPPSTVGSMCSARAVADPVALGQARLRQMPQTERTL
ncbi:hypothetical protein [Streptomyces sp. BPTC-684]|uniref:hypothetical protein n=1 Tax=Streptomyces sp. BPTC-684 TaxID=3043734 RepID=UPI0024B17DAF|nr:hypothetical protein [Streptomyces sp. BPTC-684]WHM35808.1 hypothetical protein QIY60_02060 [Streptomyces sp. BPTC-684]